VEIPWHRVIGMALTQYFSGTRWRVEVEVDLSVQQQRLDIVILRHTGQGQEPVWPDGFGEPAEYNLLTFKALKDPLNAWAIKELAAHSVAYRKLRSPSVKKLLPEEQFRLFAASMHFPQQLAGQIPLQPCGPGAYDIQWGTDTIRILVLREMPDAEQNVVWNLFSGERDCIATAFQRLQPRLHTWSSLLNELLGNYGLEGMAMPFTMEDFEREVQEKVLQKMGPEKVMGHYSPKQRLEGLSTEQRLEGLSTEQRLEGLSVEEIETIVRQLKAKSSTEPPKPRS
jgi:hypothetical protein